MNIHILFRDTELEAKSALLDLEKDKAIQVLDDEDIKR